MAAVDCGGREGGCQLDLVGSEVGPRQRVNAAIGVCAGGRKHRLKLGPDGVGRGRWRMETKRQEAQKQAGGSKATEESSEQKQARAVVEREAMLANAGCFRGREKAQRRGCRSLQHQQQHQQHQQHQQQQLDIDGECKTQRRQEQPWNMGSNLARPGRWSLVRSGKLRQERVGQFDRSHSRPSPPVGCPCPPASQLGSFLVSRHGSESTCPALLAGIARRGPAARRLGNPCPPQPGWRRWWDEPQTGQTAPSPSLSTAPSSNPRDRQKGSGGGGQTQRKWSVLFSPVMGCHPSRRFWYRSGAEPMG
ncbi:hypothetical protein B0T17DRAFT_642741 [Bombardia bombarda]|uniref:Uncharacterized protein n=1 Tax=Bombardia bombarda TaxID=252184 RepID=A0AA39WLY1_9PEZI|nr:hypothetical protein B0T17DRAFT_642741 [Bombardia bombarda]